MVDVTQGTEGFLRRDNREVEDISWILVDWMSTWTEISGGLVLYVSVNVESEGIDEMVAE